MRILHAALPEDWDAAHDAGSYDVSTRGVSIVEVDFVHASTAAQLPGVLARHYADVPAVELLVLDVDRLEHEGASVQWDAVEGVDDGPYPHVYGVIPVVAVAEVVPVGRSDDGSWAVPDLSSYDVATGPSGPPSP